MDRALRKTHRAALRRAQIASRALDGLSGRLLLTSGNGPSIRREGEVSRRWANSR